MSTTEKNDMSHTLLSDVGVLDLTHYVAGPYCTKLLADYGADVIKIEKPASGDPARRMGPFPNDEPHPEKSGLFLHLNTNKKGITLNLKTKMGQKIFKQLAEGADIVVDNFAPRVMPSLGLDHEHLKGINPKLITASISNFGQTGPYREFKASNLILEGIGGEMYSTGVAEREPVKLGPNVSLYMAGAAAVVAIMGAFYGARYRGIGQHVDMSITEALAGGAERRVVNLLSYQYRKEIGIRFAGNERGYPSGVYPCQDGYVNLVGGRAYWERIFKMLGSPEFLLHPKWLTDTAQSDPQLKEEFEAYFIGWLMKHTKLEVVEIGQAARVPILPDQTTEEVYNAPHFNDRGCFVEINHPKVGKLKYSGPPVLLSEIKQRLARPAPMLGQHNLEVYTTLGYTKSDMVTLRQQGII